MKKYVAAFFSLCFFISNAQNNKTQCDSIYSIVDSMPSFPNGNSEIIKFLLKHLPLTDSIIGNSMGGTIYVTLVVKKNGELTDIKLLRGIHTHADTEILKILHMMPAWIPGKQNGEPACVRLVLPIRIHMK